MSPFLRRLAGLLGRTAERDAPGSGAPNASDSPAPAGRRRGGRGRGSGRGAASTPPPADNRTGRSRPDVRPSAGGSNGANGQGGGNYGNSSYDRRRPRRRDLDQPLPEDIAFRPPAEGGDRSILPSRRRPPPGLRATKRVLLTGHRFVPRGPAGETDLVAEDLPEVTIVLPDTSGQPPTSEGALTQSAEGAARTGRRRRGRRGGKGRNRGRGGGSEGASTDNGA